MTPSRDRPLPLWLARKIAVGVAPIALGLGLWDALKAGAGEFRFEQRLQWSATREAFAKMWRTGDWP